MRIIQIMKYLQTNSMKNKTALNNANGFSLIELMIVVAIIGLLAAIGIPQYAKFQAKARQSEAKGSLSAIYSAETSFLNEWACYVSDLRNIGAGVAGVNLRYLAGFSTGIAANPGGCNAGAPPHGGANFNQTDGNAVAAALALISPGATWSGALTLATMRTQITTSHLAPAAATFRAAAVGDPKNTITPGPAATALDVWTIDNTKLISNTQSGI